MKKKILFRADGNSDMGLGHLYRLFAIFEMLKDHYECVFVTKESSATHVIPTGYTKKIIPENIDILQEPQWFSERYLPFEHIIVADGYQFTSEYQRQIKEEAFTLVYIDDLTTEHMYADLVINHSPHAQRTDYVAEPDTSFALGTSYAILRPSFLEEAQKERHIEQIERVFICFGGSDIHDLTSRFLKELLDLSAIKEFHILLGGAYDFSRIFELEQKNKERVFLYKNLDEDGIISLGKKCELAIVPTSTISYEVCSIKMLILGGYYVENQKYIYEALLKEQIIFDGGDFRTNVKGKYNKQVEKILNTPTVAINAYLKRQKHVIDGRSGERILQRINEISQDSILLRKANLQDTELLYNWVNNEEVRRNSINKSPIKWEDHKIWFKNKLADSTTLLLILEVNGIAVGQVRFDKVGEHFEIDYSVDEKYRGKGYGTTLIKRGILYLNHLKGRHKIVAKVSALNLASRKVFERIGFSFNKVEMNHNEPYDVFSLQKN